MEKCLPSQSLFFKLLLLENATLLAVGVQKWTFKLQRTADEYTAKCRVYKRPDQQKYTLSSSFGVVLMSCKVNFHVVRSVRVKAIVVCQIHGATPHLPPPQ